MSKYNTLLYFRLSYVWPSVVNTGSLITSIVNGHWKDSKTKEATAPAAAGSARDMLSVGAGAGAVVLLLALPPNTEQRWKQQSAMLLMIHPKATS
jgi:hypothetical protein